MSKPPTTARTVKKPAPAPVRPQNTPAKKPVPPSVKPQTRSASVPSKSAVPSRPPPPAVKKPAPPAVKPQSTASKAVTRPPVKAPVGKTPSAPSVAQAPKADNWISRTVQGYVQKGGDYVGGYIGGIADKVNGVGENIGGAITNTTRVWGQGVSGYGNEIKDQVGIGGARASTYGNPLGLAGVGGARGLPPSAGDKGVRSAGKGTGSNPLGI